MKDPFSPLKHDEPWDEEMVRRADPWGLGSPVYYRALAANRRRFEREEAQRQEQLHLLDKKELVAKQYVGHWTLMVWERIVCGDYPPEFSTYTAQKIGVLERAALISIDAARGNRPHHPDAWSREVLEARITALKAKREAKLEAGQRWEQQEAEKRTQAFGKREPTSHERARRAQDTELALSPLARDLTRQIRELSAMITSKQESLYADTLNEQAHDRLYESVQRDSARMEALQRALAEAEQSQTGASNESPIQNDGAGWKC